MSASNIEWAQAISRFNLRNPSLPNIPENALVLFDNITVLTVVEDGDICLGMSKQRGWIKFSWMSSNRVLSDQEMEAAFLLSKADALNYFGDMPIGGIFSETCPYRWEHGDIVIPQGNMLLSDLWGADNIVINEPPGLMNFQVENNDGELTGTQPFAKVYSYYLPTDRITVGLF